MVMRTYDLVNGKLELAHPYEHPVLTEEFFTFFDTVHEEVKLSEDGTLVMRFGKMKRNNKVYIDLAAAEPLKVAPAALGEADGPKKKNAFDL